ncbi:MAG: hypothetical protein FJ042_08910 [Candidatus Cloacimonetes bacterium]|nr:hypothetical protein [Candidatus Cloacimonadota bacterium]
MKHDSRYPAVLTLLMTMVSGCLSAQFAGGSRTASDPYRITPPRLRKPVG